MCRCGGHVGHADPRREGESKSGRECTRSLSDVRQDSTVPCSISSAFYSIMTVPLFGWQMFADLRQFTKLGADYTAQIGGGVDGGHAEGSWLGSATKVAINNSTTEAQEVS